MGLSKFKLPHYMLPSYPFTAIFVASWIAGLDSQKISIWNRIQNVQYVLLILFMIILNFWFFPTDNILFIIIYILLFIVVLLKLFVRPENSLQLILKGVYVVILFWLPFNTNFFYKLLAYQGGQNLAKEVKIKGIDNENIFLFGNLDLPYSFEYYTSYIHKNIQIDELSQLLHSKRNLYLFIEEKDLYLLKDNKFNYSILAKANDYRITILTLEFLNPSSRKKVLQQVYLIKMEQPATLN